MGQERFRARLGDEPAIRAKRFWWSIRLSVYASLRAPEELRQPGFWDPGCSKAISDSVIMDAERGYLHTDRSAGYNACMAPRPLLTLTLLIACVGTSFADKPKLAVSATAARGCILYLTDGSAWEVRAENREQAASWPLKTQVAIYRTNDSAWPYRLILRPGKPDGDILSAKRLVKVR